MPMAATLTPSVCAEKHTNGLTTEFSTKIPRKVEGTPLYTPQKPWLFKPKKAPKIGALKTKIFVTYKHYEFVSSFNLATALS